MSSSTDWKLDGKVALVTGGTGVLGRAMAAGLANAGAQVVITGRSEARTRDVAASVATEGLPVQGFELNVFDRESIIACEQRVDQELGPVSILINAVGGNDPAATTAPDRTFFELDHDALARVIDLNLAAGLIQPVQVFAKSMVEHGQGGSIINISSMSAQRPLTRVAGYGAAKAAVENFTRWLAVHLAQEYAPAVRVNAVAPGFFLTEQNRFLLVNDSGEPTERGRAIISHTPLGRYGDPEDLVGAVLWLASDASRFVTGTVIPVDGGFSAFSGV
ncbi:MAG: SDR family oxidoreductase [Candidatus Hydrogenedens sp.]|nr:SDR family oxidoreductase [Candidatus Hydrogenedens sp.]